LRAQRFSAEQQSLGFQSVGKAEHAVVDCTAFFFRAGVAPAEGA
jgi:hypothetical protein